MTVHRGSTLHVNFLARKEHLDNVHKITLEQENHKQNSSQCDAFMIKIIQPFKQTTIINLLAELPNDQS